MRRSLATRMTDALAYVAVRVVVCIVQSLPRSTCERFARSWADVLANRVKIRRSVVRENLQQAFPEWTPAQSREAARGMWEHLLLMVIEIAHAERVIRKTTWRRHLRIHDMEAMVRDPYAGGWLYEFEGEPDGRCLDVDGYRGLLDATIDRLLEKQKGEEAP